MELNWADRIDSACTCCACEAVDWVQVHDGTRRYACRECLEELLRFGTVDSLEALPQTPQAVVCPACSLLTLESDTGPANRCPSCSPVSEQQVVEAAQKALAEDEREDHEA